MFYLQELYGCFLSKLRCSARAPLAVQGINGLKSAPILPFALLSLRKSAAFAVFCEMKKASAHDVITTKIYRHSTGNAFLIIAISKKIKILKC